MHRAIRIYFGREHKGGREGVVTRVHFIRTQRPINTIEIGSTELRNGCDGSLLCDARRFRGPATANASELTAAASRAKHVDSRRRHALACSAWDESRQPAWLTSESFSQQIQPLLANIPTSAIRLQIGVSRWYAGKIRQGYRPHPRHWQSLAELVGVSPEA